MNKSKILHKGVVSKIDIDNISVTILSESACSSCHIKGACKTSDSEYKIIDIPLKGNEHIKVNQKVIVKIDESLGIKAFILAYFVPFIVMLVFLIITSYFTENELIVGLTSIISLVPYYAVLYFLSKKFKKSFVFSLEEDY